MRSETLLLVLLFSACISNHGGTVADSSKQPSAYLHGRIEKVPVKMEQVITSGEPFSGPQERCWNLKK
jgi:hypothetical protein